MAEEGEELKGYYERKIRNLEEALEKALPGDGERTVGKGRSDQIYLCAAEADGRTYHRAC